MFLTPLTVNILFMLFGMSCSLSFLNKNKTRNRNFKLMHYSCSKCLATMTCILAIHLH